MSGDAAPGSDYEARQKRMRLARDKLDRLEQFVRLLIEDATSSDVRTSIRLYDMRKALIEAIADGEF